MYESGDVFNARRKLWYEILEVWCSRDVLQTYRTLHTKEARERMLDALKSKVLNTLVDSNEFGNKQGVYLKSKNRSETTALERAIHSEGLSFTHGQRDRILEELSKWGITKTRCQRLVEHDRESSKYKSNYFTGGLFRIFSTDQTVTKSGSRARDMSKLRRILIKDLNLFETSKGCCIMGKLVGYPRMIVGVTTLLEDDEGDITQISLYNVVPQSAEMFTLAEKMFPHGLELTIAEPFYKIFRDGNRGIRVDDPSDICIVNSESNDFENIRRKGKELMDSGGHLMAFEIYFNGVKSLADDIIPLLNNRSQTENKLTQYEEALLDAAAVLFFKFDQEAQQRYHHALQNLGSTENDESIRNIWMRILKKGVAIETSSCGTGCKETGNELYLTGKYREAKEEYTSAMLHPNACILLTNVAVASLKLNMFQTAISASSACLRISRDEQRRQKAYYCISKAFLMLGEPDLYKLSATQLHNRKELDNLLKVVNNSENIFNATLRECSNYDSISKMVEIFSHSINLVCDFLQPKTMEVAYIDKKGRGVKAIRNIRKGELLLVDSPVACGGVDHVETKTVTTSRNFNTHLKYGVGHVNLILKLLTIVNYDGVLAKKLLCLETRKTSNKQSLPLVDLQSFSYRNLSYEILPFLPQTNDNLCTQPNDILCTEIDESFVKNVLDVNAFEYDVIDKDSQCNGSALCLRISFFNHDKMFNCRVLPFGDSLVLFATSDIQKGCELTICYSRDDTRWEFNKPL